MVLFFRVGFVVRTRDDHRRQVSSRHYCYDLSLNENTERTIVMHLGDPSSARKVVLPQAGNLQ